MQLDRTRIAIRARGIWEILDLALRVISRYGPALLASAAVLAVPLALFNAYALNGIVADEYSTVTIGRYLWLMTLLVFLEAPLATVGTTAVLGRVMFLQNTSWRSIVSDIWQVAPQLLWTQGIGRGVAIGLLLAARLDESLDVTAVQSWLFALAVGNVAMRVARPFLNEIVLLERTPLRRRDSRTVTTGRRIRSLHRPSTSDLVGRWILTAAACLALTLSLAMTLWFATAMISNTWRWGALMVKWIVPTTMWLVVVYSVVVRFLSYLDLRIRREGWEVELLVRAAALELRGQTT